MRDMTAAFSRFGQTIYFTHNHRTDPASQLLNRNNDAILAHSFKDMDFDGKIAIHEDVQVKPRVYNSSAGNNDWTSLNAYEMREMAIRLILTHKLSIYNSHMITRTNYCREHLDLALRQHYFERLHPTIPFRPYVFFRGAKVIFNRASVGNGRTGANVPNNKPCIIVEIFEINTHELEDRHKNGTVTPYLQLSGQKRKLDTTTAVVLEQTAEEKMVVPGSKKVSTLATVQDDYKVSKVQAHCSRYLVVFELSSFSNVIMNDARYESWPELHSSKADYVEHRIDHERLRFLNQIRNGTAPNVLRVPKQSGPPEFMLVDTEKVFCVCPWRNDTHNFLNWGFCTTVHKFQGLQIDNIVYWLLTGSQYETFEVFYTALTRCRRKEILVHFS